MIVTTVGTVAHANITGDADGADCVGGRYVLRLPGWVVRKVGLEFVCGCKGLERSWARERKDIARARDGRVAR